MQQRLNLTAILACPQCHSELVVTLDQIHEEHVVRCHTCGVPVELDAEQLEPPPGSEDLGGAWQYA